MFSILLFHTLTSTQFYFLDRVLPRRAIQIITAQRTRLVYARMPIFNNLSDLMVKDGGVDLLAEEVIVESWDTRLDGLAR